MLTISLNKNFGNFSSETVIKDLEFPFFFFWLHPWPIKVPWPRIEPAPQQQPKPVRDNA